MNFPSSASFHRHAPAAWLRVTGADAAEFLQGQFTNDLRPLQMGSSLYGLWLDQKGKVLADSHITRGLTADEFWIGSTASPADLIRRRLEDYIIADDVTVEDLTAAWSGAALFGEGTRAWLASAPRPGFYFRGRAAAGENWEWIFPAADAAAAFAELAGGRELSDAAVARGRILAGLPTVPADIGPRDLPNEGGLEADAISYTKGCYLGQEVMARLKTKGRIRRRLRRVRGKVPPPAVPAELWQGAARAGELRSAAPDEAGGGFVGLALLSVSSFAPGQPLSLVADGPGLIACDD